MINSYRDYLLTTTSLSSTVVIPKVDFQKLSRNTIMDSNILSKRKK
jgi:hypothetical protein